MVNVIEIDLGQLGVHFPRDRVGMVIAQPFLSLTAEPFKIRAEEKARAFQYIDDTLAVALGRFHQGEKTHFTVFPECSLPGKDGVDRITAALVNGNWPSETVVIAGVDALSRDELGELLQQANTTYDQVGNALGNIGDDQWVNCSITWAKLPSGEVHRWIQPKLAPAWVERNTRYQSMYEGRSIFLFKGKYRDSDSPYRFATLLCFDWIGAHEARRMWQWLLHGINIIAVEKEAILPLTWLFVAQCNPAPSHASFMRQVVEFYDQNQFHNVSRTNTCIVMANVAGKDVPGAANEFGQSAVIFASDRISNPKCMATYCNGGGSQRPGNPLENVHDFVFRERGACIHSFLAVNPEALAQGAAGRSVALIRPTVHPFFGTTDNRAPARMVPAETKWIYDDLDDATKSLAHKHPTVPLVGRAAVAHQTTVSGLQGLSAEAVNKTVLIASSETDFDIPDLWTKQESDAVSHVLQTVSILEIAQLSPTLDGLNTHATIQKGEELIEVVAVIGPTHEECDKHVMAKVVPHRRLLMVSRDADNATWDEREQSFLDQGSGNGANYRFTDMRTGIVRVAYHDVLKAYRSAANEAKLKESIDASIP